MLCILPKEISALVLISVSITCGSSHTTAPARHRLSPVLVVLGCPGCCFSSTSIRTTLRAQHIYLFLRNDTQSVHSYQLVLTSIIHKNQIILCTLIFHNVSNWLSSFKPIVWQYNKLMVSPHGYTMTLTI